MIAGIILAHFLVAASAPLLVRLGSGRGFLAAALLPTLGFAWLVSLGSRVLAGEVVTEHFDWIPALGVSLDLRVGLVSWVMGLVVTGVGALILSYCRWYFTPGPSATRCLGLMTAFAGAMLGLVNADNLVLLYVFWELTTVFSYLLIGNDSTRRANRSAALTALIVTATGGLAMLVGIVSLAVQTGTLSLAAILAQPPTGPAASVAALLLLVGALSKSALVPFHFWLPGAMAAPTPVSAYLHAAAMVKAGVYLIAVIAPVFAGTPGWRLVVGGLGVATMIVGGWRSLRQGDLKLLLAYGTVSQLGFMVMLTGLGTQSAMLAGLAMTIAHALFKSGLFLAVGAIDQATGTREISELSGVGRQMPYLAAGAGLAAASMAGLPPMLGFVGKEAAFESLTFLVIDGDGAGITPAVAVLMIAGVVFGSGLTVAYSLRFWWGAFATRGRPTLVQARTAGLVVAPILLGLLSLAGGLAGEWLGWVLEPHTTIVEVGRPSSGLGLWHGFGWPLALSVVAVVGGAVMFWKRDAIARAQETFPHFTTAHDFYNNSMRVIDVVAVEITARTQRGSLAYYLSTILTLFLVLAGGIVLVAPDWPVLLPYDHPFQLAIGGIMIVAAVLATWSRGRVRAVLLVGVTGYGTGLLFLLHGAPDVALTQILVETAMLVVFLLVLRSLPKYFTDRPLHSTRWWRVVMAVAVGATVTGAALLASGARVAEPISTGLEEIIPEYGYGNNIVNVILVDTRSWDTIGEISVLVIAATGVASLIFLRSRVQHVSRPEVDREDGRALWLRTSGSLDPMARSLMFEVVTRLIFGAIMMVSIYLLFSGHNWTGGGFAGGLVAGMALIVRYLAAGGRELDEAAPFDPGILLGSGLLIAVGSAVTPALLGGKIFQSYDAHVDLWGVSIHVVSSTIFDVAVYLIVMGMLLDVARSLGAGIDDQDAEGRTPLPRPESTSAISASDRGGLQ